ncbi:P-loop NTPase fold protein [uncultured Desulfuromusa sp.]|uniref:P-loop NTPase fold protein n=1 Tax=uncultured Desulfuromusa sp. TaxID=219183 RepID=UPI002AA88BE6|nr:P-loop NTPase fold protein [uncultured Desulfuromusa sp.]
MSIDILESQIARFLASEAPEVMSIKGAWGVGKTYAWNKYLVNAKNQKKIALKKYSYVSLFGINSLDDLKFSIFENMVDEQLFGRRPTIESFKNNTEHLLRSLGKKTLPIISSNASIDHYHSIISSLSFLSLEKTIICIDDFERKGNSIDAQDILGLITQLKEQKKCKVILILNDESLSEGSSIDYVRLREKVIDTELRFAPTAEDCVAIALSGGKVADLLGNNIIKLGINNIRIIKKIEKLAALLLPHLKNYEDQVLYQALRTISLLTWCYYGQSGDTPDYNFVVSRNSAFGDLDDEIMLSTQQQVWCAVLRGYDNYSVDEFDLQIARLVENGYVHENSLREEAKLLNEKILAARSEDSFQEAWRKFNGSFDDNDQEVISCLSDSFKHNAKYISPVNLDGTVRLLRYLGKDKLATKIIDLYLEKRKTESELFNLEGSALPGKIKDHEVIEKFKKKYASLSVKRSLQDICDQILAGDSCSDEEEVHMSQATVQEYIGLFKSQKGQKLSQYVDLCLKFRRLGGTTEQQDLISEKSSEALKIIGRESKLNASRVKRFGIKVE